MSDIVYQAHNIHKTYTLGSQVLKILQGVNLSVKRGEILGIVGASGVGKSTLLHILGLLDRPDTGKVLFGGEEVNFRERGKNARIRNHSLGFVFQFYHLLPELTALENVCLTSMMDCSVTAWYSRRKQVREKAASLLSALGLGERLRHRPTQLSGGERQRVAIARALMSDPDLLFCDEPTGNLDEKTSGTIVDLLFRLNQERTQTMVVVTHNESFATRMPRLLRLSEGRLHSVN